MLFETYVCLSVVTVYNWNQNLSRLSIFAYYFRISYWNWSVVDCIIERCFGLRFQRISNRESYRSSSNLALNSILSWRKSRNTEKVIFLTPITFNYIMTVHHFNEYYFDYSILWFLNLGGKCVDIPLIFQKWSKSL